MAAQQGVNCTNGLFMKEENPAGGEQDIMIAFFSVYLYFKISCISNENPAERSAETQR